MSQNNAPPSNAPDEKNVIDQVAKEVLPPEAPDSEAGIRSPTTTTGLPVEEQIRKEWDPKKGGLPTFFR